jgi:DUF971 family protein
MNVPVEIRQAPRLLTFVWPDGTVQRFAHAALRSACPCSACRRLRLAGTPVEASADVELTGMAPMGYGVQLIFSDGHDRGVFPWTWFRDFGSPAE